MPESTDYQSQAYFAKFTEKHTQALKYPQFAYLAAWQIDLKQLLFVFSHLQLSC